MINTTATARQRATQGLPPMQTQAGAAQPAASGKGGPIQPLQSDSTVLLRAGKGGPVHPTRLLRDSGKGGPTRPFDIDAMSLNPLSSSRTVVDQLEGWYISMGGR